MNFAVPRFFSFEVREGDVGEIVAQGQECAEPGGD